MSETHQIDDIVKDFLVESHEGLDQLDRDLVLLEQSVSDSQLLGRIFRSIHTIKGTCGFLGFEQLEAVTHVGENLLAQLRDGRVPVSPDLTTALLALVDATRLMLGHIEVTGAEVDRDYSGLIEQLTRLQCVDVVSTSNVDLLAHSARLGDRLGDRLVRAGEVESADVAAALQEQTAGRDAMIGDILVSRSAVREAAVIEALDAQQDAKGGGVADSSIRVDVGLLDRLMTLVGELVLARNQIVQHANSAGTDGALLTSAQRLNLLTTELQEGVMKTRMQPIGNVWSKFPRVVRDLSVACGKQIRLEMEGRDTELDKTIIEAIKDPLTHLVRNAADHGIEEAEQRRATGKPLEGVISLRAFHEGGQVIIEINDDGRGMHPDRLRQKAIEKQIISPEQAVRMSDREALSLIFLPGFSTAAAVTNISGRGVGMDVVRTNIEKIGGVIDVHSVPGQGTSLKIKIPLTLAIIPGLMVTTDGDRFAIPQVNLLELVRLEGNALSDIAMVYGAPVYRLRGQLLPLVHLNRALGLVTGPWQPHDDAVVNIVVLQADGSPFGLVLDEINDTEEIVVKPLARQLKSIGLFSGATIMGDGRVALILDVLGLAQRGGVLAGSRDRTVGTRDVTQGDASTETRAMLLFGLGAERRMAVPLSSISRLEEFRADVVERSGCREVVQYRNGIMPLIRLHEALGIPRRTEDETVPLQVLVYSFESRSIGLVVDQILDVVDVDAAQTIRRGTGVLNGSLVVQGRVTDLVDVDALVRDLEK